jgi:hypothetical protein
MLRVALLLSLALIVAANVGCDEDSATARAGEGSDAGVEACHPSYPDDCLDPDTYDNDYDCAGGEGDGPHYIAGPVTVAGDDPFDLDRDGDGTGCDSF